MQQTESGVFFTKNLQMKAAGLEHILAELKDPATLGSLLGVEVEPGWPPGEYDRGAQEFFRDRLREGGAAAAGWYCWYAIRKGDRQNRPVLVGAGGYMGPPDKNGKVEIGFSVMPQWRGLGYATEMAEFLVARAFGDRRVHIVCAQTTPQNKASCQVLEKVGFTAGDIDGASGVVGYEIRLKYWGYNEK